MNLSQEQKDNIKELSSNLQMDLVDAIEDSEAESIDELDDYLVDNEYFNIEIIYYHNAMEYLLNNDAGLQNSLEIANNMGYETKDLNSEILASLLASQNEREEFDKIREDLEAILFSTIDK